MTTTRKSGAFGALGALAALGLAAAPTAAWAEDSAITISLPVEVQVDHVSDASDGSDGTDVFTTIEPEVNIGLSHGLSIQAGFTLEPVQDRLGGDDRYFEDHGAYVSTLQLIWETDSFTANVGKFTPVFALEPDYANGMYGDTFLGDYELTERLGAGASVAVPVEGVADITFTGALFMRDRSPLAGSIITDRGSLSLSDGTPGNTESLENGTFAVDVVPAALPDLLIRASYLHQGKGQGDTADQDAYGLGAAYSWEVNEDLSFTPMVDWVRSHDVIGFTDGASVAGSRNDTITTGLGVAYGPWFGSVTQGWRNIDGAGALNSEDDFTQVSVGYAFDMGLSVEAGWLDQDNGGVDSTTFGAVVAYGWEF